MMINLNRKKQQTNASARVVDGKLILSLPDATTPVVWQMDLAQAKASALEVRHNEEKGEYTLTLKTPKGETVEVAPFSEREHAVEGLMAASNALENAHGQIRSASATVNTESAANDTAGSIPPGSPQAKKANRNKWLTAILSVLLLFILFTIWSSIIPRQVRTGGADTAASTAAADPQGAAGVPVSADAFLKNR